ncbi:MAG: hypothetical protein LBM93_11475 [Oscillospiraceae bacterium]|nr:hypothetical protein [Oscillospiraceae bacterium]
MTENRDIKKFLINIFLFIPYTYLLDLSFLLFGFRYDLLISVIGLIVLMTAERIINKNRLNAAKFAFLTASFGFFFSIIGGVLKILPGLNKLVKLTEEKYAKEPADFDVPPDYIIEPFSFFVICMIICGIYAIACGIYAIAKIIHLARERKRTKIMTIKKTPFIKTKFLINIFLFIPLTFVFGILIIFPFKTWESYGFLFAFAIDLGILLGLEFYLNKTFLKATLFSFLTSILCFLFFILFASLGMYLPGQEILIKVVQNHYGKTSDIIWSDWPHSAEMTLFIFLISTCFYLAIIADIVRFITNIIHSIKKKMRKNYDE